MKLACATLGPCVLILGLAAHASGQVQAKPDVVLLIPPELAGFAEIFPKSFEYIRAEEGRAAKLRTEIGRSPSELRNPRYVIHFPKASYVQGLVRAPAAGAPPRPTAVWDGEYALWFRPSPDERLVLLARSRVYGMWHPVKPGDSLPKVVSERVLAQIGGDFVYILGPKLFDHRLTHPPDRPRVWLVGTGPKGDAVQIRLRNGLPVRVWLDLENWQPPAAPNAPRLIVGNISVTVRLDPGEERTLQVKVPADKRTFPSRSFQLFGLHILDDNLNTVEDNRLGPVKPDPPVKPAVPE